MKVVIIPSTLTVIGEEGIFSCMVLHARVDLVLKRYESRWMTLFSDNTWWTITFKLACDHISREGRFSIKFFKNTLGVIIFYFQNLCAQRHLVYRYLICHFT